MDVSFTPTKVTYKEQVYDMLENRIIHGILKPGQKLSAPELAASLGISRSPVREAIIALNQEGLVEIKKGNWAVAQISLVDVMESYEARKIIEGNSAKSGAVKCSDSLVDEMGATLKELSRTEDNETWWQKNKKFHELIVLSCGNKKFHEIHLWIMKGIRWCGVLNMESWKRRQNNLEHERILSTFAARDPLGCEKAIVDHLSAVQDIISKDWDKYR